MRLIINATNLQSGGALQVALAVLQEWNAAFPEHEYHVFLSPQLQALLADRSFHFRLYSFAHNPGSSLWQALTFYRKLSALEAKIRPDAVFTLFGPALWRPKAVHVCGFANGYYLFDQSAYIRNHTRTNLLLRVHYYVRRFLLLGQLSREADVLWVETEAAKQQLWQEWRRKRPYTAVIGNTYSSQLQQETAITDEQYRFLCLAAYYPHKNLESLSGVIRILKRKEKIMPYPGYAAG